MARTRCPEGVSTQVVVAIPAGLLRRVSDELKDLPGPGSNIAAGADDTHRFMVTGHPLIEARSERSVSPVRSVMPRIGGPNAPPTLGQDQTMYSLGLYHIWVLRGADLAGRPPWPGA